MCDDHDRRDRISVVEKGSQCFNNIERPPTSCQMIEAQLFLSMYKERLMSSRTDPFHHNNTKHFAVTSSAINLDPSTKYHAAHHQPC